MNILITPATSAPVTVAQLKEDIGIYHTEKDTILSLKIDTAVDYAERFTGRQLMPAVWELQVSHYFEFIQLPKPPFISIVSVKYYNSNNELISLVADTDFMVASSNPAIIQFITEFSLYDRPDALQIRYNCGYANAAAVPPMIRAAIIMMAGKMYQNPVDSVENLPKASTNLLNQYRLWPNQSA